MRTALRVDVVGLRHRHHDRVDPEQGQADCGQERRQPPTVPPRRRAEPTRRYGPGVHPGDSTRSSSGLGAGDTFVPAPYEPAPNPARSRGDRPAVGVVQHRHSRAHPVAARRVRPGGDGDRRHRGDPRSDRPRNGREGHEGPRDHRLVHRRGARRAGRGRGPQDRRRHGGERPGPDLPDASGRQDPGQRQRPGEDARRPLDGLHPGCCARVHRDPPRRRASLVADRQGQHGRRGLRRDGGARSRRHRPRGGDAR